MEFFLGFKFNNDLILISPSIFIYENNLKLLYILVDRVISNAIVHYIGSFTSYFYYL